MDMVLLTHHDDGTTLITINRPERRNAICAQTAIELQQAFAEFDHSTQKVAVVTGSGDAAFSSGADVSSLLGNSLAPERVDEQRYAQALGVSLEP